MKRRTKVEMTWMESDVREWLYKCENDPHKAWDEYIKDMLLTGSCRAYYIKGIKDFVMVSEKVKHEDRQEQERIERVNESKANKEMVLDQVKNMSVDYYKQYIRPLMKQTEDENIKMTIVYMWTLVSEKDYRGINDSDIRWIGKVMDMAHEESA